MIMSRDTRDVSSMYDIWTKSHSQNSGKEDSVFLNGETGRGPVSVARDPIFEAPTRDVSAMYDIWQNQHRYSQPEIYVDALEGPGVVEGKNFEGDFLGGAETSRDVGRMYDLWETLHSVVQGRGGKRYGRGELDLGFGERCGNGSGGGMGGGDWVVV